MENIVIRLENKDNHRAVEAFDATYPKREKEWMSSQEEFYIYSRSSVIRQCGRCYRDGIIFQRKTEQKIGP